MTEERGAELLRHGKTSPRATFLELFFDVVYVFALTRVSYRLVSAFTTNRRTLLPEVGQTLLLLLALWLVWSLTAWTTSRYDPQRPAIQLVVVGSMFGSMVMAVSLPEAFDTRGLSFVLGYILIQVGRPLFVVWAVRGHPQRQIATGLLVWSSISAVPWLIGALASNDARGVWWTLALLVDYGAAWLGWPLPRFGRAPASGWAITAEHLAERYQQFTIIAIGEMILITGLGFSGSEVGPVRWVALAIAFGTSVLLWRIYFYRAGTLLGDAVAASPRPARLAQSATYTHLVMVAGIVTTAVGYDLVITHPLGHTDPAWLLAIIGGPALFVVGRARFEYEVFGRVSPSRPAGLIALLVMAPAMLLVPPLAVGAATTLVLSGIAVADAVRARGRPAERPAPAL
jgi:low temperature requirement protein LtrA